MCTVYVVYITNIQYVVYITNQLETGTLDTWWLSWSSQIILSHRCSAIKALHYIKSILTPASIYWCLEVITSRWAVTTFSVGLGLVIFTYRVHPPITEENMATREEKTMEMKEWEGGERRGTREITQKGKVLEGWREDKMEGENQRM